MPREISGENYFTLPEVAGKIGVSHMTVYRWACKGTATDGTKLKVVRDSVSRHYYIAQKSAEELAERYDPTRRFVLKFDPQPI